MVRHGKWEEGERAAHAAVGETTESHRERALLQPRLVRTNLGRKQTKTRTRRGRDRRSAWLLRRRIDEATRELGNPHLAGV